MIDVMSYFDNDVVLSSSLFFSFFLGQRLLINESMLLPNYNNIFLTRVFMPLNNMFVFTNKNLWLLSSIDFFLFAFKSADLIIIFLNTTEYQVIDQRPLNNCTAQSRKKHLPGTIINKE